MHNPKILYKTTIVVWSNESTSECEIVNIAKEATDGKFYCSKQKCIQVSRERLCKDPDWDETEFFLED